MNMGNLKMDKDAIEKMVESFAAEMQQKEAERLDFVENLQDDYMERLYTELKADPYVDVDELYHERWVGIQGHLFDHLVAEVMYAAKETGKLQNDGDIHFPNESAYILYKDMRMTFFQMSGQGTHTSVSARPEDAWDDKAALTYEEVKDINLEYGLDKIYVGHSTSIPFREELYPAIQASEWFAKSKMIFPHESSDEPMDSLAALHRAKYMIAEVSEPSLGLGIELGWASLLGVELILIHREGAKLSRSLSAITTDSTTMISYADAADLTHKLNRYMEAKEADTE